jgi:hypothetical protein
MRCGLWCMRVTVLSCLIIALFVAGAWAGPRDHDGGFFLRLSAGPGTATTSFDLFGADLEISGPTGDANLAIGGMVTRNLALHATLFGWVASDPDMSFLGRTGRLSADVSLSGLGIGLTYYFMPVNIYVSGSVGAASLTVESGQTSGETDLGPAMDLTLGKEWWVSESWGLGVAGAFGYHSVPEKDIEGDWTGTSFGIRFTASYN